MADPVRWFTARFKAEGTADRTAHEKAYLRSDLTHLGVTVPGIRQAVRHDLAAQPQEDADDASKTARALLGGRNPCLPRAPAQRLPSPA